MFLCHALSLRADPTMTHDDDLMREAPPLFRLDAGWLFLAAGLALLAATVLIPAHDDLQQAELVLARAKAQRATPRLASRTTASISGGARPRPTATSSKNWPRRT